MVWTVAEDGNVVAIWSGIALTPLIIDGVNPRRLVFVVDEAKFVERFADQSYQYVKARLTFNTLSHVKNDW